MGPGPVLGAGPHPDTRTEKDLGGDEGWDRDAWRLEEPRGALPGGDCGGTALRKAEGKGSFWRLGRMKAAKAVQS